MPRALPWIPGHMPLVVWGSCLSAVGAVGGWVVGAEGLGPADGAAEGVRSRPLPSVFSFVSWE